MSVVVLGNESTAAWNDYLAQHDTACHYHQLEWRDVLEQTFGLEPHYLLWKNQQGAVEGILPLFSIKNVLGQRFVTSLPFSTEAGVCASSGPVARDLVKAAIDFAETRGARYLELRQRDSFSAASMECQTDFVTMQLRLDGNPADLWEKLSSRNRNKVRKAEKHNYSVRLGIEYLDAFQQVYEQNLRDLGTPSFPARMFKRLAEKSGEATDLLTVWSGGSCVAGMFLWRFRSVLAEPWVASLRSERKFYVNNFLYWKAIEHAFAMGVSIFDFGRSTVDSGTYKFKKQWGAQPVKLKYCYKLLRAGGIPVANANENRYGAAISVWRRLPVRLTSRLGPILVRYLPEL